MATSARVEFPRAVPRAAAETTQHRWLGLALGRICDVCEVIQPEREFNDDVPCPGKHL